MPIVLRIVVAAVLVVGVVAVATHIKRRNKNSSEKRNDRKWRSSPSPVVPCNGKEDAPPDITDKDIAVKACRQLGLGIDVDSYATEFVITHDWLLDDVFVKEFGLDYLKMDLFLGAIIELSQRRYTCAAKKGEQFDRSRMVSQKILPGYSIVETVLHRGLVSVRDGNVVLKAEVE